MDGIGKFRLDFQHVGIAQRVVAEELAEIFAGALQQLAGSFLLAYEANLGLAVALGHEGLLAQILLQTQQFGFGQVAVEIHLHLQVFAHHFA